MTLTFYTFAILYLNPFPNKLWFLCVCSNVFENTEGKGDIAPLPTVFSICLKKFLPFSSDLKLLPANSFCLEVSKICCLGKG